MKMTLLALLFLGAFLRAAEPGKLLDALRAELARQMNEKPAGDKTAVPRRDFRIENFLMQLPPGDTLRDETLSQTLQAVDQFRAVPNSEKINGMCAALAAELRDRIAKNQKALKDDYDSTLRSALKTGLSAKEAKDLDIPLQQLARLKKDFSSINIHGDTQARINHEALAPAEQILTAIQDAMITAADPNGNRGRNVMERLQSMTAYQTGHILEFIPRSEYLEKVQTLTARLFPDAQTRGLSQQEFDKQVQDAVSGIKKLEDMSTALEKLTQINKRPKDFTSHSDNGAIINELRSYCRVYDAIRSGESYSLGLATSLNSTQTPASLQPTRNLLAKFALTRHLGITGERTPREDESPPAYLFRILQTAQQDSDWALMSRVLDAVQSLGYSSVASSSDQTALRHVLAGVNQEKARVYNGAACSYILALRSGSQAVPVEKIGEMLDKLKRDHPQDYESGAQSAITWAFAGDPRFTNQSPSGNSGPKTPVRPGSFPFSRNPVSAKENPSQAEDKKNASESGPSAKN